jgi:lia operon protein LiaG
MFNKIDTKKVVLWLFVIMISSFIIAGMIFVQTGGYNEIKSGKYNHQIDETTLLKADNIKQIKIECDSSDVHIIPVDSNEISSHLYGSTGSKDKGNDPKLDAKIVNGQLIIKVKKTFILGINFSLYKGLTLDVSIPRTYSSDISINTNSGNTTVEGFNLNKLNSTQSSGNVSIKSVTSKDCVLKLRSGNVKIDSFSGNLKVNSHSGNVSVDYKEFKNNVNISATSGNVKLRLPQSAEFFINANATSGDVSNSFPITVTGAVRHNKVEGTVVKGDNKIIIKTYSGDIDISK